MTLFGVFNLGIDIGKAGLDRGQFVAANPAAQDFSAPGFGIERPRSSSLADQRNREGEIICSDDQNDLAFALRVHAMFGVIRIDESFSRFGIRDLIAGGHDIVAAPAKDGQQGFAIAGLGGADEGRDGLLR